MTSLAHEQFIKGELYQKFIRGAEREVERFREACAKANIPEIKAKKSLRDVLAWALNVLKKLRPRLRYTLPNEGGEVALDLFGIRRSIARRRIVGGLLELVRVMIAPSFVEGAQVAPSFCGQNWPGRLLRHCS